MQFRKIAAVAGTALMTTMSFAGAALAQIDNTDAKQAIADAEQSLIQAKLQLQKDTAQAPIDYQKSIEALDDAKKLKESDGLFVFYAKLLPAAIPLVEKWEIKGLTNPVTYETFPASPRLVAWLVECVTDLYNKTNDSDPNSPGG